jgi:hypothetical protein
LLFVQLLAGKKECPMDGDPLRHDSIDAYKPNFGLMDIVSALRSDASCQYRLPSGKIRFEKNDQSYLGEGGGGIVYRGAMLPQSVQSTHVVFPHAAPSAPL